MDLGNQQPYFDRSRRYDGVLANRRHRYLVVAWPEADPLAWMWERLAQDPAPGKARLAALEAGRPSMLVYARGLAGALTASGRRRLRFWT